MFQTSIHRRTFLRAAGVALPVLALPGLSRGKDADLFTYASHGGWGTDAEHGFFDVPEDRRDPSSRKIRLGFVRLPSTAARPGPPIVYLAGGPGGSGVHAAKGPRLPLFRALTAVADVIALDQRGTGLSAHIPPVATPTAWPDLTRDAMTSFMREQLRRSWLQWTEAGVSISGYTTEQSADDVEDLRRHLGSEQISLWGISYGTHLALSVLKRHPDSVSRVALASLEGQDQTVKRPAHIDKFLRRVDGLVAGDPAIRAAVPDLSGLMRGVHEQLDARPVTVATRSGDHQVGGFAVQLLAAGMLADPATIAQLPALYLALKSWPAETLAQVAPSPEALLTLRGMPEAMDLASGVSPERLIQIDAERRTAVLGDATNFPMPHLIGAVPGHDLGDEFRKPIHTRVPALLISGSLDGRTPLEEQDEVVVQFGDRSRLLVENAGHNVLESHPKVQTTLVRFFGEQSVADATLTLPAPSFMTM